jgi:hypothetical protein
MKHKDLLDPMGVNKRAELYLAEHPGTVCAVFFSRERRARASNLLTKEFRQRFHRFDVRAENLESGQDRHS